MATDSGGKQIGNHLAWGRGFAVIDAVGNPVHYHSRAIRAKLHEILYHLELESAKLFPGTVVYELGHTGVCLLLSLIAGPRYINENLFDPKKKKKSGDDGVTTIITKIFQISTSSSA